MLGGRLRLRKDVAHALALTSLCLFPSMAGTNFQLGSRAFTWEVMAGRRPYSITENPCPIEATRKHHT